VDPIGYRDFLGLGANARLLVSDSGGIQEEVSVYKKPAVVVRRSTERQEVEGTFVTRLEPNPELASGLSIAWDEAEDRTETLQSIPSPYGDSKSPDRAVAAIRDLVERAS
jgi:UDP-N-acetylglucosamine 2-epimerase (non-hydrolysing)